MLMDQLIGRGSAITVIFNFIIITYVIYYSFIKNEYRFSFLYLFLYAFFFLILIILSSTNLPYSIRNYIKYFEGVLCFPLAFSLFRNEEIVNKLWWLFKAFLILFLLNYILANTLHWGNRYGGDVGAETGNMLENGLYLNVCAASIAPIFIQKEKYRFLVIGLLCVNLVISIVILKRAVIAAMIFSFLVYFVYNLYFKARYGSISKNNTRKLFLYFFTISFVLFLIYSFKGVLESQIQTRSNRFVKGAMEQEGRVRELKSIYNDIVNSDDDMTFFFGRETFNIVGTYGAELHFGKRNIHDDFGIILNGSGVVGFFLYFFINAMIIFRFIRYSKSVNLSTNKTARNMYVAFISFWAIFLTASTSDTILQSLYPAMHYTVSGMILRYFYEYGETYESLCLEDIEYTENDKTTIKT